MLIRYMGQKDLKSLKLNNRIYVFNPSCNVEDKEAINFLLHKERNGLFKEIKETSLNMKSVDNSDKDSSNKYPVKKNQKTDFDSIIWDRKTGDNTLKDPRGQLPKD